MLKQLHFYSKIQFVAALVDDMCSILGTDKLRTTPYEPQDNGQCKRVNRTLVPMLRRAVQTRHFDWQSHLS